MALSGHAQCADECPLLGAKRTLTNRCLPISIFEYTEAPVPAALEVRETLALTARSEGSHRTCYTKKLRYCWLMVSRNLGRAGVELGENGSVTPTS